MNNTGFSKGDILVPNVENMTAWSVIACDQYTSQPQYWREVEKFVGTKPSTLNMMVPEIDFTSTDLEQHIAPLTAPCAPTWRRHLFSEVHDYIYTRRILSNGKVRCGLIGVIDLEQYEFNPGLPHHCPCDRRGHPKPYRAKTEHPRCRSARGVPHHAAD